jgi:uncharacterized membrane protein
MGKKSKSKPKIKARELQTRQPGDKKERTDKRDTVRGQTKGGGRSTFVGLGIAAVIIAVVAFVMFGGGPGGVQVVEAVNGAVKIPIAEINDGKAHHYAFDGSRRVNFFVMRSSDGVYRAAFDACDVCFREKKGYRQEGDLMVCNNCGQVFPSEKINVLKGGCNPAPLTRTVEGDYLVLKSKDIDEGSFYF